MSPATLQDKIKQIIQMSARMENNFSTHQKVMKLTKLVMDTTADNIETIIDKAPEAHRQNLRTIVNHNNIGNHHKMVTGATEHGPVAMYSMEYGGKTYYFTIHNTNFSTQVKLVSSKGHIFTKYHYHDGIYMPLEYKNFIDKEIASRIRIKERNKIMKTMEPLEFAEPQITTVRYSNGGREEVVCWPEFNFAYANVVGPFALSGQSGRKLSNSINDLSNPNLRLGLRIDSCIVRSSNKTLFVSIFYIDEKFYPIVGHSISNEFPNDMKTKFVNKNDQKIIQAAVEAYKNRENLPLDPKPFIWRPL